MPRPRASGSLLPAVVLDAAQNPQLKQAGPGSGTLLGRFDNHGVLPTALWLPRGLSGHGAALRDLSFFVAVLGLIEPNAVTGMVLIPAGMLLVGLFGGRRR